MDAKFNGNSSIWYEAAPVEFEGDPKEKGKIPWAITWCRYVGQPDMALYLQTCLAENG